MKRNKPKVESNTLEELMAAAQQRLEDYKPEKDNDIYSKKVEKDSLRKFNEDRRIQAG